MRRIVDISLALVLNCLMDICSMRIVSAEVTQPLQAKQSVNETVAFPLVSALRMLGYTISIAGSISGLTHSWEGVM